MEVIKRCADKWGDLSPFFLAAGMTFVLMRREISRKRRKEELDGNGRSSLRIVVFFCQ